MFKRILVKLKSYLSGFFLPVVQAVRSLAMTHFDKLIFLFIPVAYLLNVTVAHYSLGPFFMGRVDPEYFYMYNGIVLGAGNLSIQYYFHPGTPLHFLIAVSARIIDLFQPGDYMKNFVDDPEKYIHAASLFLNIAVAITLFICGRYTKKYTSSYAAGIAMQLIPFGSAALLLLQGRVFADAMLIIPLLFMVLLVLKHVFSESKTDGYVHDTVLFGLVTGFGIACKLTFVPVLLIPLVLLRNSIKQKILLVLYSAFFFAVFAYPVIFNLDDFWEWAYGKFSQAGQSGEGHAAYSNFTGIYQNFALLVKANKELFAAAITSLVVSGLFSLRHFTSRSLPNVKLRRAIFAVNITLAVCLILTLKYFKLYYYTPFTVFTYFLVILTVWLLFSYRKVSESRLYRSIIVGSVSVLILLSICIQALEMRSLIKDNNERKARIQQEYYQVTSLVKNDRPIIIAGPYYGAPFIEFAHFAGFSMTDNMKGFYTSYLKTKYPNTYQYVTWSDKFDFWDDFVDFKSILDKTGSSFYIYIGKENSIDLLEIENRMWKYLDKNSVTINVLYEDKNSQEKLLEVTNIQHSTFNIQH